MHLIPFVFPLVKNEQMCYKRDMLSDLSAQIVIIGAGPLGIEMAAVLKRHGADYLHFESHQIGHTLTWWPRNTYFFSTTERIEIAGIPAPNYDQQRLTGEQYLAYLRSIIEQLDLQIYTYERVVNIEHFGDSFLLTTRSLTGERRITCQKIILANGDMDFPNYLGISGEDLPHVSHYFTDPHMYFRKRLLIVGGRNSAVEAALRCWRAGAEVTVSYRRSDFDVKSVKHWLLPDIQTQIELGTIKFLPQTIPLEITPFHVLLAKCKDELVQDTRMEFPADFVLLNTGFRADTQLFEAAGVQLEGVEKAPVHNPKTMETNVPGIYICGTSAAGTQTKYRLFVENCHEHVGKIALALTGRWPSKLGTIPARQYEMPLEDIETN